jgi:hypothetical protein
MDIESFTKSITQYISDGPLNDLFTNPIYISLLITTIVILIVVCMFNESRLIKTSFYILFANMFIIFVHNKLLLMEHRRQLCNSDTENICNTIGAGPTIFGRDNLVGGLEYLSI